MLLASILDNREWSLNIVEHIVIHYSTQCIVDNVFILGIETG